MVAFLGVVGFFLIPVSVIIIIIQAIRRKPLKKWLAVCGAGVICFALCLALDWDTEYTTPPTQETEIQQAESEEPVVETQEESEIPTEEVKEISEEVKKFAEENGISVELAQSVQDVLLETDIPDSLNILNGWEQTEDYAYGQRYIAQSYSLAQDKHFYVMFYVQDDEVVSVRDRKNGLEELWRK